jgi:cytidyltransferase-like protein
VIVTFEALQNYQGQVSMVDGAFDPLHAGHIAYFRAAAALGVPLLCNVAADDYVRTKHPLLLPGHQRARVIDALRDITLTHLNETDTTTVLEQLRPRAYIKGADWMDKLPPGQIAICGELGIEIVYLETVSESSSRLLQAMRSADRTSITDSHVGMTVGDCASRFV